MNDVDTATATPAVAHRSAPALTTGIALVTVTVLDVVCFRPSSSVTVNVNVTLASSRPVNVGACTEALLNVAPADTDHAYDTIVPSESVDVAPDTTIEEPSTTVTGPEIVATGATFAGATTTTAVSQPTPPSSSVTQTLTVKLPAAAYVCDREKPTATAPTSVNADPSPQSIVAVCVSSVPASVNDVDTPTATPTVAPRSGPAFTAGKAFVTVTVVDVVCVAPSSSVTVNVKVAEASSRPVNVGACTDALLNVAPADTVHAYDTTVPSESVDEAPDTTIEEPSTTVTGPEITATGATFAGRRHRHDRGVTTDTAIVISHTDRHRERRRRPHRCANG